MRSYENSGYNPYNDNYRSETRSSGRNYYSSDDYGLGSSSGSSRGSYSNRAGGFGSARDTYSDTGHGHTSTYGRSAGSGSSDYGSHSGWTGSRWDRDRHSGRDTWDRAGDEVKSWFGDDDAERRRRRDERQDRREERRDEIRNRISDRWDNRDERRDEIRNRISDRWDNRDERRDEIRNRISDRWGNSGSGSYGLSTYGTGYTTSGGYGSSTDYDRDRHDRGFFERAGDEVKSWFGDEEAERRRRMDEMRDRDNDYNRYGSSSSSYSSGTYSGPPYSYGSSSRRDYEW
ncbi:SWFGD domain-containing protein [Pontibacter ruber]|uniref:SWFGD domain-containing protein n=1 Tax=Pontibacter ruber TaxID=1343895 RepID=A0ABW5CT12_9BACT|nr:SWFGD domain-containing protein [Pontibacter ruber]